MRNRAKCVRPSNKGDVWTHLWVDRKHGLTVVDGETGDRANRQVGDGINREAGVGVDVEESPGLRIHK